MASSFSVVYGYKYSLPKGPRLNPSGDSWLFLRVLATNAISDDDMQESESVGTPLEASESSSEYGSLKSGSVGTAAKRKTVRSETSQKNLTFPEALHLFL